MGETETEVQQQQPEEQAEAARASRAASLVDANSIIDSLKAKLAEVDAAVNATTAKLAEITEAATIALAAKSQITDNQEVIKTKSEHIEAARVHADGVRAELDRNLTAATQKVTEAEAHRARAQGAADGIAPIVATITTTKASTQADLTATNAARDEAKAASAVMKALADKAAAVEANVAGYEASLAGFQKQANEKLATITSLLPGATSAGLAHAFDARRQTFLRPVALWEKVFVGSVLALALLAGSSLLSVYGTHAVPPWDEMWRMWAIRIPFAIPLIWLAMHAGSKSALAQRLEEDYGFKAATAAQFQGFQEQMAKVGTLSPDSSLAKLCADTLAIIGNPPGRIYDKHELTVKPGSEIAAVGAAVAAAVKDVLSPAKKEK